MTNNSTNSSILVLKLSLANVLANQQGLGSFIGATWTVKNREGIQIRWPCEEVKCAFCVIFPV